MTETTPIFPLQLVVFPGDTLNLHIFEPRYKELIGESFSNDNTFGIPTYFEKKQLEFGTSIRIDKIVKKYSDGKLDIQTSGLDVFKVLKVNRSVPGKLYSNAKIEYQDQNYNGEKELNNQIIELIIDLYSIMSIDKDLASPNDPQFCYRTCHYIGMNLEQKYELLKLKSEYERQLYVLDYLKELIPTAKKMEQMRIQAKMNGHFRNFDALDF